MHGSAFHLLQRQKWTAWWKTVKGTVICWSEGMPLHQAMTEVRPDNLFYSNQPNIWLELISVFLFRTIIFTPPPARVQRDMNQLIERARGAPIRHECASVATSTDVEVASFGTQTDDTVREGTPFFIDTLERGGGGAGVTTTWPIHHYLRWQIFV